MEIVVIGSGMAGLRVAMLRAQAGDTVTVLDKGRRHGGRMATRRVDDVTFDTGVLDLAAHGPEFTAMLRAAAAGGSAQPVPGTDGRWRGRPTMRALPASLAERSGCEVRLGTTVTGLSVDAGRWRIALGTDDASATVRADALVLTAPAPQSVALLRTGDRLASPTTLRLLEQVSYTMTLTVLTRSMDPALGPDALRTPGPDALAGTDLARLHRAGAADTPEVVAFTLQGTPSFSAEHLDGDRRAAADLLAAQATGLVGTQLDVVHVHGWRYAQVTRGIARPALRDDTSGAPLVLAGDLFDPEGAEPNGVGAEGVERAFTSGTVAARLLTAA